MLSTGGACCQVSDSQTAQSQVHTACTVLSSLRWESVQTSLFPSWLQFGFEPLKGSVVDDPPPEASAGAPRPFLRILVVQ